MDSDRAPLLDTVMTREDPTGPGAERSTLELDAEHRILVELSRDAAAGALRSLSEYQARHPGLEALVSREYEALAAAHGEGREQIGRFRVLRPLGRGSQGRVFEAEDTETGEPCALKVFFPPAATRGDSAGLRFEREVAALEALDHPGIEAVLEAGRAGAHRTLACELIEGQTLAEWVGGHRAAGTHAPVARVLAIGEALATALHAAHEAGIVHRDVKPSNVMLAANGRVVLIDFGLARALEDSPEATLTATSELLGTPTYAAPEVLLGWTPEYGPAADVYSLGATLYEALALEPPFPDRTWEDALADPLRRAPNVRHKRPDLPRDAGLVLATALRREPAERYANARELAQDLARARRRVRVRARGERWLTRLVRWFQRAPLVSLGMLACLALVLLALGFGLNWARAERAALREAQQWSDYQRARGLLAQANATLPRLPGDSHPEAHEHRLIAATDPLWPELPAGVAAMDAWLEKAGAVLARPWWTTAGAAPAGASSRALEPRTLRVELEVAERVVRARRGRAERRGHMEAAVRAAWERTIQEVRADPRFEGFEPRPLPWLQPLGRDPVSGLQEFFCTPTGARPQRSAGSGELVVSEGSGLVLVLLPGGTFWMGTTRPSEDRPLGTPNVEPLATRGGEDPVRSVTLAPFYLSKYELTQGQWQHLTGANPSRSAPGSDALEPIDLRHPVENVPWNVGLFELQKLGLTYPTEAQWEYAARAGTTTRWWCGDDQESLRGNLNMADLSAERAGLAFPRAAFWPDFDDGFALHAPVGTLPANPFGLHELLGNVSEFCLDPWLLYDHPVRSGDGLRLGVADTRAVRGGCYSDSLLLCRPTSRQESLPDSSTFNRGLRPALTPERAP